MSRASCGRAKLGSLFGHSAEAQEAACDVGAYTEEMVEAIHCGIFCGLGGLGFAYFAGDDKNGVVERLAKRTKTSDNCRLASN